MRGPPACGCLVEEAVVGIVQRLEAVQVVAAAQTLAVAHLADGLKACADAAVAAGAVGEKADLDLSVAAAVHFLLVEDLGALAVYDQRAAVGVGIGVQKVAARVVLVVLLLVAVAQGLLQLRGQLAAPLGEGRGVLLDPFSLLELGVGTF